MDRPDSARTAMEASTPRARTAMEASTPRAELDELRDLTRALRRRVCLTDGSDWVAPASSSKTGKLAELAEQIRACRACPLGSSRLRAVPGVGSPEAKVMFIGEGPGFQEDHEGEPFVGPSGRLLDKIMESIGLSRRTVYIANIVKCHAMKDPSHPEKHGNDRAPTPEEMDACRSWLAAQIRAIGPRVIVTLGAVPAKALLSDQTPITQIRGRWRTYDPGANLPPIKLLPTFHPAALLRNPDLKRDVWRDMISLREELSQP